jgi:hypothetical protein
MQVANPFGKYAGLVAAVAALGILGAWLATAVLPALATSETLNAMALVVVGAIFGTGAGAIAVTNGLGPRVDAMQKRLDASGAPAAGAIDGAADGDGAVTPGGAP